MIKLSLAITTYQRYDLTIKSFEKVIEDNRIDDIVVVDDCSPDGSGQRLADYFKGNEKVRVIIQAQNRKMQQNKADAVSFAFNDWVILLDSDNQIQKKYLDALEECCYENGHFHENTIYAPVRALETFKYDIFEGLTIGRQNVKGFVKVPLFGALINTSNYLVHKEIYANNYRYQPEIKGVDTAAHFLRHITNGGLFHVVRGLEYDHALSQDSEFMKDVHYNMASAMDIEKKLLEL